MFLGHGLLAFTVAAWVADRLGWPSERALAVGLAAGAFALVPDVDMAYAPVGLVEVGVVGPFVAAEAFWSTGNVVHRAVTHSLVVGALAAPAFALWAVRKRAGGVDRVLAGASLAVLGGLVAVTGVESTLDALVMAAFAVAGIAVAVLAARRGRLGPRAVLAAALLGLWSHPFGDLFTGEPPALLYPFDAVVVVERVVLHPDPTLHLLGVFGLELATFWLAALVYLSLDGGRRVREHVDPRAALGVAYAGAALVMPAPTLETSYHFVFSVLAVGTVGIDPRLSRRIAGRHGRGRYDGYATVALTGLTAVTLASAAYAAAYLFV